jgi:membrane associated rhomboid family serine protease
MEFDFPDDRPVSLKSRWMRLSLAARLAIFLGAVYAAQLLLFLFLQEDLIAGALSLQPKPASWKLIYQIFSYGLVHATTQPLHVTMNAVFLFFCGTLLESSRGPRTMLTIFVSGVALGGVFFAGSQYLQDGPGRPLVGASGGVYAVLVAAAVSFPNLEVIFRLPLWVFTALYVGLDFVQFAIEYRQNSHEGAVAYVAHLGGALAGLVLAIRGIHDSPYRVSWSERIRGKIRQSADRARERKESARAAELDRILEKIHAQGMSALTEAEKRFLKDASSDIQNQGRDRANARFEAGVGGRKEP